MRKAVLCAVLAATTSLIPVKAAAAPVAAAFAAIGAITIGSTTVAALAVKVVGNVALGLVLGAVAKSYADPPRVPDLQAQQGNITQPVMYQERCYGRVRKGGAVNLTRLVQNPGGRIYNIVFAAHEVDGFEQLYLDDRPVSINGVNQVATPPFDATVGETAPFSIDLHNGWPGQAANPRLINLVDGWTSAHDMAGCAYATVFAPAVPDDLYQRLYPAPTIATPTKLTALLRGKRLYDPRTGQTVWSSNAALVMAAEATYHGFDVDWAQVAIEANHCDELIVNAQGQGQPRWIINMVVSDDMKWDDIRAQMSLACDAYWYQAPGGKLGFRVGRYEEPEVVLNDRDFFRIRISTGTPDNGAPTELVGRYAEPSNARRSTPSGVVQIAPSAEPNRREVEMPAVDTHNQAVRILIREGHKARPQATVSATTTLAALKLFMRGDRFVRIVLQERGFNEVIEITRLDLVNNWTQLKLSGHVVSPGHFSPDIVEPERPVLQTVAPAPFIVPPPSNVNAVLYDIVSSSRTEAGIRVTWQPADNSYGHVVLYRIKSDPAVEWSQQFLPPLRIGGRVRAAERFDFLGVDGATYEVLVLSVNQGNMMSDPEPETPLEIQKFSDRTPPGQIVSVVPRPIGGPTNDIAVDIVPPGSTNFAFARVKRAVYPAKYKGPFPEAHTAIVGDQPGFPGNAVTFTDRNLPYGVVSYYVRAANGSSIGHEPPFGPILTETYDPTVPPDDLIDVVPLGGVGQIRWTGIAPEWRNFIGVRMYRSPTSDFANAVPDGDFVPLPWDDGFDVSIPTAAGTAYFWLFPVAFSQVLGTGDGPHAVTIT